MTWLETEVNTLNESQTSRISELERENKLLSSKVRSLEAERNEVQLSFAAASEEKSSVNNQIKQLYDELKSTKALLSSEQSKLVSAKESYAQHLTACGASETGLCGQIKVI